jgi:hypothetical protein
MNRPSTARPVSLRPVIHVVGGQPLQPKRIHAFQPTAQRFGKPKQTFRVAWDAHSGRH